MRERLAQHRQNATCNSCHSVIDPLGFSLENFDATGAWRVHDGPYPVDPGGQLYDGTKVNGPVSLRAALVGRSDMFVRNFTVKLLTYALGRGVQYYDMPVVRAIDRDASREDNRFTSLVMGIVKSAPFQMRRAEPRDAASSDLAAQR